MVKKFVESKHKRDERGRFAEMETSALKKRQMIELEGSNKVISGAKSGALDPTSERAVAHAERAYKSFMKTKADTHKISKITGCTEAQIEEIKEYVFNNPDFTPDYDQAQTWTRLRDGNPIAADFVFIKHELMEISLVKKGMPQEEAHEETNKYHNYGVAIKEWRNGYNKKNKGNR